MPSAISLRSDFTASALRRLAGASRHARQSRRLLSLAAVLDGMSRDAAARIGGMDRQTLPKGRMPSCCLIAPGGTSPKSSSCRRTSPSSSCRHAPQLNPVENIWQCLRANWLSNRVFGSYVDILGAACEAWNKLTEQPSVITSIGTRKWAHVGQN